MRVKIPGTNRRAGGGGGQGSILREKKASLQSDVTVKLKAHTTTVVFTEVDKDNFVFIII
jgi:hypothetical protein